MVAKQLRLPKFGRLQGQDNHPRAHLFRTIALLGQAEDRALAAAENFSYNDYNDLGPLDDPYFAVEAELDRAIEQSRTFYQVVIAPLCRAWWVA